MVIMVKKRLTITAIAVLAIILVASGMFFAQGAPVLRESIYLSYQYDNDPGQLGNYYLPLTDVSVVRDGNPVSIFTSIGVENYETDQGFQFPDSKTVGIHEDPYGYLAIHETMTSVVEFEAKADNSVRFHLGGDIGAIRSGNAILIGSEDASGVFVFPPAVDPSIMGQDIIFDVPADSKVTFRLSFQKVQTSNIKSVNWKLIT